MTHSHPEHLSAKAPGSPGPHSEQPVPKTQVMAGAPADEHPCSRGAAPTVHLRLGPCSWPPGHWAPRTSTPILLILSRKDPKTDSPRVTRDVRLSQCPPGGLAIDSQCGLLNRVWLEKKVPLVWLNLPRLRRCSAENTDNTTRKQCQRRGCSSVVLPIFRGTPAWASCNGRHSLGLT